MNLLSNLWKKKQAFLLNPLFLSLIVFGILCLIFIFEMLKSNFAISSGYSYETIAMSIIKGQGFSNPFSPADTGPTSWMPPFIVWIYTLSYAIFGINLKSFIFLKIVDFLFISSGIYLVLRTLKNIFSPKIYLIFLPLVLLFLYYYRGNTTSVFEDFGIYTLAFGVYISLAYILTHSQKIPLVYYLLLFVIGLSCPSLFLPLLLLFIVALFHELKNKYRENNKTFNFNIYLKSFYKYFFLGLPILIATFGWGYRNYVVFDKFIISKSNIWFEFYQANAESSNGLSSAVITAKTHPNENKALCDTIIKYGGEQQWLDTYNQKSKLYLENESDDYLIKIKKRLFFSFVFTYYPYDKVKSKAIAGLSNKEKEILNKYNIIRSNYWLTIFSKNDDTKVILDTYLPEKSTLLMKDLEECRQEYRSQNMKKSYLFKGFLMSGIPFLSALLLLFLRGRNIYILVLIIGYFSYELPYVLISTYFRYQAVKFLLDSVIISILIYYIFQFFRKKNRYFNHKPIL